MVASITVEDDVDILLEVDTGGPKKKEDVSYV